MVILTMMIMMMMLRVWLVFDLYFPHVDKKQYKTFPFTLKPIGEEYTYRHWYERRRPTTKTVVIL